MAAAILGIFASTYGIAATTYGLVNVQESEFQNGGDKRSALKIHLGLDINGLSNAGGDLPDTRLFNVGGEFLGMVADPGNKLSDGEARPYSVGQDNNQQAMYTLFSANDDAICISYVTISMAGQSGPGNNYGVMGDFGKLCGGPWYYGNVAVQGADYMPTCLWIDANGDQPATGFQVNWLDMQVQANDNRTDKNVDDVPTLCNTPSFTIYNNPDPNTISYWTGNRRRSFDHSKVAKAEGPPSKHSESQPRRRGQFSQRFDNVLVIDDTSEHSAQQLCESETSAGPDFVNSGEMFCDMKTKTAYPLCNNSNNEAVYPHTNTTLTQCFDLKTKMLSLVSAKDMK